MQSTVGPVKNVVMNYSSAGKSTGTATIVFRQKGDANKAHGACELAMVDVVWREALRDVQSIVLIADHNRMIDNR